ncbi:MAG: hypothetical protein ACK5RS_09645, partial [Acidobacteriota bacterium]
MTRLIRTTILMVNVLLAAVMIAGQVEGQVLAERTFEAPSTAEVVLDLTASSPGAAWIAPGREAAALRSLLDGAPNQDLLLYGGAEPFTYHLSLGQVAAGRHTLRIDFNPAQSATSLT